MNIIYNYPTGVCGREFIQQNTNKLDTLVIAPKVLHESWGDFLVSTRESLHKVDTSKYLRVIIDTDLPPPGSKTFTKIINACNGKRLIFFPVTLHKPWSIGALLSVSKKPTKTKYKELNPFYINRYFRNKWRKI